MAAAGHAPTCACSCACARPTGPPPIRCESPADVSVSNLAGLGALLGDPARVNMLVALLHSGQLTARQLADGAGITPQTASGHLSRLLAAGLVKLARRGRYHHYSLASEDAGELLATLQVAGDRLRSQVRAVASCPIELSLLRSCRQHMAGRLAVSLARSLADGDMAPGRALSSAGRGLLARWGLDFAPRQSASLEDCLDWSEGAPHVGGALGCAMLAHSVGLGWVRRGRSGARLDLTPAGRAGFQHRFGVRLDHEPGPARSG